MDSQEANLESIVLFGPQEGAAILEGNDITPLVKEAWHFTSMDEHLVDLDVKPALNVLDVRKAVGVGGKADDWMGRAEEYFRAVDRLLQGAR